MAINETAMIDFSPLGPLEGVFTTIFTMIGGVVGLYIIMLVLRYYENKKLMKSLAEIRQELVSVKKQVKGLQRKIA
jgi:uncharacterized membrane-anchored protein YhcB (DUF1043 family)